MRFFSSEMKKPLLARLLWIICIGAAAPLGSFAQRAEAGDVRLSARDCSSTSANIKAADPKWDGLMVCYGPKGFVEWTLDIESPGPYYVNCLRASGEARPVKLSVNGERLAGDFLGEVTGGFMAPHLRWATLGPFPFSKGRSTLRIEAAGLMPHFAGIVISSDRQRWNRDGFAEAFLKEEERVPEKPEVLREQMAATRAAIRNVLGADEIVFIKRVTYTSNHYYTEYLNSRWTPGGGIFVLSLKDGTERQLAGELQGGVFGRMDLSFDARKVVFDWKRSTEEGYRIYEVGIDGRGLRQVLKAPDDEAEVIRKYRPDNTEKATYHSGSDDMHPCYLPDGGFAFISTRCRTSTLCNGGDAFTTTVLYRMEADGSRLRQLSFGALSEATPTMLPDGRILYTRWEYVDKGTVAVKCLWAMRPDGTASAEIYGNDIPFPPTMIQGRAIPGAPNQYVFLGCPHYPQNALGTVIRIDMDKPVRTDEPMTYLTPDVKILAEGGWEFRDPGSGGRGRDAAGNGPLFRDPYPLDADRFLVAHKPRGLGPAYSPNGYGLYLLDSSGKAEPFYRDPEISCWQPMPLAARETPPPIPDAADPHLAERNLARCIVTDIYHGLENVPRGAVKYIRILEQIPRPWSARRFGRGPVDSYDQQYAVVSKNTGLGLKVQHGVVPVEQDGSAHFLVPANANIFMQVLDENHLAVQTERTFVNYMPGETRTCIGCHETPDASPALSSYGPIALRREPSMPGPQPGETSGRRPLHYPSDVQPVLDRRCVECHNEKVKEGGLDLTGRMTTFFSASYENLLMDRRGGGTDPLDAGLLPTIGENHPKTGNVRYLEPKRLGSHNSLLVAMLMPQAVQLTGDEARLQLLGRLVKAHGSVKLQPEELLKLSNWVDTNAQYYGSYYGRRNLKDVGHPNFRPAPTWESAIGIRPADEE